MATVRIIEHKIGRDGGRSWKWLRPPDKPNDDDDDDVLRCSPHDNDQLDGFKRLAAIIATIQTHITDVQPIKTSRKLRCDVQLADYFAITGLQRFFRADIYLDIAV